MRSGDLDGPLPHRPLAGRHVRSPRAVPYTIVTGEPVLDGDIASPPVNAATAAFGLGDATWPSTAMPWVFVVDGDGVVRAKATGVVGSADIDLALSLITGEGVVAP